MRLVFFQNLAYVVIEWERKFDKIYHLYQMPKFKTLYTKMDGLFFHNPKWLNEKEIWTKSIIFIKWMNWVKFSICSNLKRKNLIYKSERLVEGVFIFFYNHFVIFKFVNSTSWFSFFITSCIAIGTSIVDSKTLKRIFFFNFNWLNII